jgi:3D (Asp-Asp-Asp) domain-containing protein
VRCLSTSRAAAWTAASAFVLVAVAVPIAVGADAAQPPRATAELQREHAALGSRAETALLELYGLETKLAAARADLAAANARRAKLRERQAATRRHLARAAKAARVTHRRLEDLVRALYVEGEPSPVAVVLGAQSLDEALAALDSLDRAAQENVRVLERARAARRQLTRLDARLAERARELAGLAATARGRARALEAAAAERRATIAELRRREHLTARQIASLEAQAQQARERTVALQAAPATTPAPAPAAAPAPAPVDDTAEPVTQAATAQVATAGTLTVTAVGYSLPGRTASGLPVGHGVVAVDPSVIPLGTRLYVPGYGEAVAADTGSAVRGAMIDLWFPTTAQALAWGRRTVVVTIR